MTFLIAVTAGLSGADDFAYREQTDHDGQHVKAALERSLTEGEAGRSLNGIRADRGEHEADDTGHDALDHVAA